ncbi:MAG: endolytic transglycosylase MltG [Alistipes sp.]|nr:endolytic transglycosylase MltG [Alistipes sp.]
MQKNSLRVVLCRVFLGGVVLGALMAVIGIVQFRGNAVRETYELFLSRHADYQALNDSLMPHLKHRAAFRLYAKRLNLEQTFKPGHYLLTPGMDVIEVVRALKLGIQTPVRLTMNNVRIPAQLAAKLAGQIDADSVAIHRALIGTTQGKPSTGLDSLKHFAMFLPDTYEVYWTTTPEELIARMEREYARFWSEERDAKRKRSGLSRWEVMTLASIVYEETRQADEMPRVAGVYINRLRKGMPLQADPTVKYAMQNFELRRILHKHLKYKSPYNTYVNKGLPPSPICMPSKQAIESVLNFEQHDYLFFCARPTFDGYHNFARTFAEHKRNAKAYAAELNRRKIK